MPCARNTVSGTTCRRQQVGGEYSGRARLGPGMRDYALRMWEDGRTGGGGGQGYEAARGRKTGRFGRACELKREQRMVRGGDAHAHRQEWWQWRWVFLGGWGLGCDRGSNRGGLVWCGAGWGGMRPGERPRLSLSPSLSSLSLSPLSHGGGWGARPGERPRRPPPCRRAPTTCVCVCVCVCVRVSLVTIVAGP